MPLATYQCARCGMAVPGQSPRCPSCRSRRRTRAVAAAAGKTGPAAAEAWETYRATRPSIDLSDGGAGDPGLRHPQVTMAITPAAVASHVVLHVLGAFAVVLGAVELIRLVMVVAADDQAELVGSSSWARLTDAAEAVGALAAGATMLAVVLVIGWAAAAGYNVRSLALDPRRWVRGTERVAGRVAAAAILAAAWAWAPGGPGQVARGVELGLAILTAAAVVQLAAAVRRFVVSVTAVELQRAELVARIEAAAVPRPRNKTVVDTAL